MVRGSWPPSTSRSATASTNGRRAADEDQRPGVGGGRDLGQHRGVDAARVAAPAGRRRAREGPGDVQPGARLELPRARRGRARPPRCARRRARAPRRRWPRGAAVAQHRHQRHEARAAADEQQRAAVVDRPREVPADRPAHLELVAGAHLLDEVGRDLAVVDELDRELERVELGRRGDRVRALRLVAVLGGQAHVDVLAGAVPGPARARRARACARAASRRRPRARSPCARRSGGGRSVAPVPLLAPRVAVVVVAGRLPEARLVVERSAPGRAPTSRSSRSTGAARAAAPGRRARGRAARRRTRRRPTPCRRVTSSSGRFVV